MNQLLNLLPELESIVSNNADRLLNQFFQHTSAQYKSDGSIVTEADTAMQKTLTSALHALMPDVKMLGEEMSVEQQQLAIDSDQSYWCLDPVDGTNNFHHGVALYAVSLALIQNRQPVLGIIYDPVRKECFSALKGGGIYLNGQPLPFVEQPASLNRCLASVDFKRLGPQQRQKLVSEMPFKSQRNIGSCALEWAWLAAGRIQLLLHGGEKIWDYAAGCLLLEESGGQSCSTDSEAIFNHSLKPRPVIAASSVQLHQQWMDYLTSIDQ